MHKKPFNQCRAIILTGFSFFLLIPYTFAGEKRSLPVQPVEARHLAEPISAIQPETVPMSPTPEPATLILFGSGLIFLGAALRRRNKKTDARMSAPAAAIHGEPNSTSASGLS